MNHLNHPVSKSSILTAGINILFVVAFNFHVFAFISSTSIILNIHQTIDQLIID